jgi:hypothetical protein
LHGGTIDEIDIELIAASVIKGALNSIESHRLLAVDGGSGWLVQRDDEDDCKTIALVINVLGHRKNEVH